MPKTGAERENDRRQRKIEAGLVKFELWIQPAWREPILKLNEWLKSGKTN